MAIKTQGTQLYFIDDLVTGGPEIVKVECATGLSGLSNPREQIETTCLESDTREYEGGLSTPGQLSVTINFDPANASHLRLYELWKANGPNIKFAIGVGEPRDTDPTLDTAGDFNFPTSRSYIEFEGYVADIPLEFVLNSVVTSTVAVQVSGSYTIHPKA